MIEFPAGLTCPTAETAEVGLIDARDGGLENIKRTPRAGLQYSKYELNPRYISALLETIFSESQRTQRRSSIHTYMDACFHHTVGFIRH